MNIIGVTMISMPCVPDREALRAAAADAYGVPVDEVSIGTYHGHENPFPPGYRVYINLWSDEYEGDLPFAFDQKVDATLAANVDASVQRMAEILGVMIVTDDSEMANPIIHLPDGTFQQRFLESLPDDGLVLPPDLKAIAISEQQAHAA